MNKKNIIRAAVVVAVVAAVIIITQIAKGRKVVEEVEPPIRPVKVMEILDTPAEFRRVFPGGMKASQTADLSFLTSGDLVTLPAREGARLKKGEVIASLDARNALNAQDSARADMVLTKSELDRSSILFKEELISRADYEVKLRAYDVAVAAYDTSTKAVEDMQIRAPFDGIVAKRYVENFEKVQAGQKIVTYYNPDGLDIVIDIPEAVVNILPEYTTEMTAVFEQVGTETYPLTVREFATVADPYTQTYAVTLFLSRPEGLRVLPDMTVTVNVDFTRKTQVENENILVPSTAVVYDVENDSSAVWVLDKNTMTVNPKKVEVDRAQNGQIVIIDGISAGDTIVTAGGGFLKPDQKVRIYNP
jgi:RND family efflux transporter MFP subunit